MTSNAPQETSIRGAGYHAVQEDAPRYGDRRGFLQAAVALFAALLAPGDQGAIAAPAVEEGSKQSARVIKLIALGDSLTAGYQLPANAAFPAVLESALRKEGYHVTIANAGVSGDTASGGLSRLDWSLGDGADGLILELGANDMLRGLDPRTTKAALDAILSKLKEKNVKVLMAGMLATPSLGKDYGAQFDAIYPDLAAKYGVLLYPFFLDGVATHPDLTLPDGLHPNAAGVEAIVKNILPSARALLASLGDKPAGG